MSVLRLLARLCLWCGVLVCAGQLAHAADLRTDVEVGDLTVDGDGIDVRIGTIEIGRARRDRGGRSTSIPLPHTDTQFSPYPYRRSQDSGRGREFTAPDTYMRVDGRTKTSTPAYVRETDIPADRILRSVGEDSAHAVETDTKQKRDIPKAVNDAIQDYAMRKAVDMHSPDAKLQDNVVGNTLLFGSSLYENLSPTSNSEAVVDGALTIGTAGFGKVVKSGCKASKTCIEVIGTVVEKVGGTLELAKLRSKVQSDLALLVRKASSPTITIQQYQQYHNEIVRDVAAQLKSQGYKVKTEISFGDACGTHRCRPDIAFEDSKGRVRIIEVKTGDADLSIRQREIFPQIRDGNAIPRGRFAERFGLEPGIPLKDQGHPDGIPIEVVSFPGV